MFDHFWSILLSFDLSPIFLYYYTNFARRMKKFAVEVLEVLSRTIEVEATNESYALEQVRQMYQKCKIVLDYSDYKETEISVKDEKSEQPAEFSKINS